MSDDAEQREAEPVPSRAANGDAPEGGAEAGAPDGPRSNGANRETRQAEAAQELSATGLYFNRELSWIDFNDRVLQLAEDESVPLLERVKFAAIFQGNLDEHFMVRVAGLHDQVESGIDARGADGMPPSQVIDRIRDRTVKLRERQERLFDDDLRPALAERGIRVIPLAEAGEEEREEARRHFKQEVFAALTPLVIGRGRPFPYISNLSISIAVLLRNPETDEHVTARVKVPKELLGRFLRVGLGGLTFIPLEDVIGDNLGELFPGMEILHHALFRVTRDTDYDVSDEADDLLQAVEDEVRRRRFGEVVRVEVGAGMDPSLRRQLFDALELEERQVYDVSSMLGFDDLVDLLDVPGFPELRYVPYKPATPRQLLKGTSPREIDFFGAIRGGDILVHHPFDSFTTSVERFVHEAVEDPNVLAIKQTVYRTSADSPLVPALVEATERGKQAACLVELKARFDESANIKWAKSLERAGVHVVYGIPGFKTHVKCVLVARREGDRVRNYVHIGTGNYNPKTAGTYTDLGLFTADPEIGADIAEMFNYLTGYARPKDYRKVLVAPFNLRDRIIEEIETTIEAHSPSDPARIRMKMNSLLDPSCIRALYEASRAGVKVRLNVRGICALRPGVPGVSENIEVVSVVGRYLEHSRIYSFERPGRETMFIGSPDLMPRNLYNRVELLTPVDSPGARDQITDVLDRVFADDTHSWRLGEDGAWNRLRPADPANPRNSQQELMDLHARAIEHSP